MIDYIRRAIDYCHYADAITLALYGIAGRFFAPLLPCRFDTLMSLFSLILPRVRSQTAHADADIFAAYAR